MAIGAALAGLFSSATSGRAHGDPAAASVSPCADVAIVFARGTFERPGVGKVGEPFVAALRQRLPNQTVAVHAVDYPASIEFGRALDGVLDASGYLRALAINCPTTKIVLGGYSQGAAIAGYLTSADVPADYALAPLPQEVAQNIHAVVLFGTPSPEVLGILHRGAPPVDIGPAFNAKTLALCAPRDPVCAPGGLDRDAHSAYAVNGMTDQAADFSAGLLGGSP
ncbi:cutinase family protein [Mycolicibacterium sp. 3033]|nr:cutinase family protein [Mycolicibacterium aurantiacum]